MVEEQVQGAVSLVVEVRLRAPKTQHLTCSCWPNFQQKDGLLEAQIARFPPCKPLVLKLFIDVFFRNNSFFFLFRKINRLLLFIHS